MIVIWFIILVSLMWPLGGAMLFGFILLLWLLAWVSVSLCSFKRQ